MTTDQLGWAIVVCLVLLCLLEVHSLRKDLHDLAEFRADQVRK